VARGEGGDVHGERAGDEIDESAAGVDQAVGADVVEVIAGEEGGDVSAKVGGDAVAEAFVKEGGCGDGQDGHADDGEFAVGGLGGCRHQAASVFDLRVKARSRTGTGQSPHWMTRFGLLLASRR
jgi:hypothetical protein